MGKRYTPTQRAALGLLDTLKFMVKHNCDDETLQGAMTQFHPASHKEYINPFDYCTVDDACKILGLGYNRNKFYEIAKQYNIVNYKNPMNNQALGFKIKEIEELACKLKES